MGEEGGSLVGLGWFLRLGAMVVGRCDGTRRDFAMVDAVTCIRENVGSLGIRIDLPVG